VSAADSQIKIESGIPIPAPHYGKPKGEIRIALEKMQPGDSILIKRDRLQPNGITKLAKSDGIKVAQRKVNCEGRRIWRVS
jgi:hypothetical protein